MQGYVRSNSTGLASRFAHSRGAAEGFDAGGLFGWFLGWLAGLLVRAVESR